MTGESQRPFQVIGVHHAAMVARDPHVAQTFFGEILGLNVAFQEHVKDQKTHVSMFEIDGVTEVPFHGMPHLELLEDDGSRGPVYQFQRKRGSGVHHIALKVNDLEACLLHLKNHDVKLVDPLPRRGAHDTRVAFVHPQATGGILIELVEEIH